MAGGVELPGEVTGLVTVNEVQMHGWDLARATGQPYEVHDELAEAVLPIVTPTGDAAADEAVRDGMFGPPVDVATDGPVFDRVLGLAGRARGGHEAVPMSSTESPARTSASTAFPRRWETPVIGITPGGTTRLRPR